ncbi:MAG: hypothetical protein E7813_02215 [Bradyrhizobium sp.]|nr:MAG: hypothetical protein E7813_02215 [Bradyrhizobium sp.]
MSTRFALFAPVGMFAGGRGTGSPYSASLFRTSFFGLAAAAFGNALCFGAAAACSGFTLSTGFAVSTGFATSTGFAVSSGFATSSGFAIATWFGGTLASTGPACITRGRSCRCSLATS